ncbi:MAG: hypothetical protein JRM86_02025 [Nitrososphaerota archaeon]|nr:hypothetical protein [Nitrososphaerota archaeon]
MKIRQLSLRDVRGVRTVAIEPLLLGVTVVVAPNEAGKSTLIEGFDLLLTELDSADKRSIRSLKPIDRDVGPEVAAELSAGPYRFSVTKRWLKKPLTELKIIEPRAEVLTGREAHQRMEGLLAEGTDLELYRALQVLQGVPLAQPALPVGGLLTRALDDAAGRSGDEPDGASLYEAVDKKRGEFYQANGLEVQEVRALRSSIDRFGPEVADLETKVRSADEEAMVHARLTRELEALQKSTEAQRPSLQELERRMEGIAHLQSELRAIEAEVGKAGEVHRGAKGAVERRAADIAEVQTTQEHLELLEKDARDASLELERRKGDVERADAVLRTGELELEGARSKARASRDVSEVSRSEFDLMLLRERQNAAQRASRELAEAEVVIAQNRVTTEALEALRELQKDEAVAQEKLKSASPRMIITATANLRARLDGRALSLKRGEVHEQTVPDRVSLDLPPGAKVEFVAGTSLEQLQAKQRSSAERLGAALRDAGVADLKGAHAANRSLLEAQEKRRAAQQSLRQALRTDLPKPFKGVFELSGKVAELEARVRTLRGALAPEVPIPDVPEKAKDLSNEADGELRSVESRVTELRRSAATAQKASQAAAASQAGAAGKLRVMSDQLASLVQSLAEARQAVSDQELVASEEKARVAVELEEKVRTEAQEKLRATDPSSVEARVDNLRRALKRGEEEINATRQRLAETAGRLSRIAEEGLYDRLEGVRATKAATEGELASRERRGKAARLLLETLAKHRAEAHRAYQGPLRERMEELGRLVYGPTFKLQLGDDLSIEQRELNGLPLPFDYLSDGTQEQLGVIARLAVAMAVGKDGGGVPVILDDTLGYTDPERLSGMGAVLDRAGRECQVIVLTCQRNRYDAVGSAKLLDVSGGSRVPTDPHG